MTVPPKEKGELTINAVVYPLIDIEERVFGAGVLSITVNEQEPDLLGSTVEVAVMVVLPVAKAVTTPELETVAMELFPLDQITLWDGELVPFTVAERLPEAFPFKSRFNTEGLTVTLVTVGEGATPLEV